MSAHHPLDVCRCGDFRHQHEGGTGRCKLGSRCTPFGCRRFRMEQPAEKYREHNPDHYEKCLKLLEKQDGKN